jgi:phosphohistidine phosphatase
MQLFVIRHGIAIDQPPGLSDEDRYLTEEGRRKTARVGEVLRQRIGRLDRILTSPLVRAVQTAEIFARELDCFDVLVSLALRPGAPLSRIDALVEDHFHAGRVALVGHEPSTSTIVAHLLGLPSFPRAFKKAGVCAIHVEEEGAAGSFDWFITPKGPTVETELEAGER